MGSCSPKPWKCPCWCPASSWHWLKHQEKPEGASKGGSPIAYVPFLTRRALVHVPETVSQTIPRPILTYVKETWKGIGIDQYHLTFPMTQAFLFTSLWLIEQAVFHMVTLGELLLQLIVLLPSPLVSHSLNSKQWHEEYLVTSVSKTLLNRHDIYIYISHTRTHTRENELNC